MKSAVIVAALSFNHRYLVVLHRLHVDLNVNAPSLVIIHEFLIIVTVTRRVAPNALSWGKSLVFAERRRLRTSLAGLQRSTAGNSV